MDFDEFATQLVKIKKLDLPGEEVQFKMAPIARLGDLKRKSVSFENVKKAGVMALFYPSVEFDTKLILTLRKRYKGVHSAQVSLPGGKIEARDRSFEDAALRETEEEVGVPRERVTIVKQLTELYIPPSNFYVQPFLGITHQTPKFTVHEREVEALIEVSLTDFMDNSCITTQTLTTSYATDLVVPAFLLNDHIVWGATAMILSEIRELLSRVL